MLATVQIPIIDLRNFTIEATRLPLPGWPAPEPNKDFLRSFGPIRRRPSGGLNGWLGEAEICEVERGVRFVGSAPRHIVVGDSLWSIRVAYRRFFADGIAMGKLEIGFDIRPQGRSSKPHEIAPVVKALLKLPITIAGEDAREIGASGTGFAQVYARATTPHGKDIGVSQRFVLAGPPCVVVEYAGHHLAAPARAYSSPAMDPQSPDIIFWHQRQFEEDIPVWLLYSPRAAWRGQSRELRLYICRLHAETEAIAKTLRAISIGAVEPAPRSLASDHLQQFLSDAFRHQRILGQKIDDRLLLPLHDQAIWHRDQVRPGYFDGLINKVKLLAPRPAFLRALEKHLAESGGKSKESKTFILGDLIMAQNNVSNSGVAGIVGSSVSVENSTVTANQTTLGSASPDALSELQLLAKTLAERAASPDEEVGASAVSNAASKLAAGDEAGALAWLKRSGAWTLKVAEEVGAKLAAELIIRAST